MIKASMVVDTNIIIDLLRGHPPAKPFFKDIEEGRIDAYYSTITEAELFSGKGLNSLENQKTVNDILALMKRVPVDGPIARKAGDLRRQNEIMLPDSIIAATAAIHSSSKVCTKNNKDFFKVSTIIAPY